MLISAVTVRREMIVAEDVQCSNHSEPHNFILKALEVRVQKQPGLLLPKITYFSSWTFSSSTKTCTGTNRGRKYKKKIWHSKLISYIQVLY